MRHRAFTLVETLVVIAVTTLILTTLASLFTYFYKTNSYALEESEAVSSARRGVEDAMKYLREATYGSDGSYPIQSAATSSMTFFANVNGGKDIEKVTYLLKSGTLLRGVASPIGNPPTYVGATTATSTIATSVTNSTSTPVFRYFDSNGVELAVPITISAITSIKTVITVDVNTTRAPVPFTLSGGATLRNIKDKL